MLWLNPEIYNECYVDFWGDSAVFRENTSLIGLWESFNGRCSH